MEQSEIFYVLICHVKSMEAVLCLLLISIGFLHACYKLFTCSLPYPCLVIWLLQIAIGWSY